MQIGPVEFYKMADCSRPEVASDVISGQNVGTIQVNIVTKFEGPSSNRLGAIRSAHFVTTTATTTATEYASHAMTPIQLCWLGLKIDSFWNFQPM